MLPGEITGYAGDENCHCCNYSWATALACTESDSMGDELTPMCEACVKIFEAEVISQKFDCTWCKNATYTPVPVRPIRDPDEGSHGPVYWLCDKHRSSLIDHHRQEDEKWEEEEENDWVDDEPSCSTCYDDPLHFMDGSDVGDCPSCRGV